MPLRLVPQHFIRMPLSCLHRSYPKHTPISKHYTKIDRFTYTAHLDALNSGERKVAFKHHRVDHSSVDPKAGQKAVMWMVSQFTGSYFQKATGSINSLLCDTLRKLITPFRLLIISGSALLCILQVNLATGIRSLGRPIPS